MLQKQFTDVVHSVLSQKYWCWYWQYFSNAVLVLVSTILFCQSIVIGIEIFFISTVNILATVMRFNMSVHSLSIYN